jgi:hypothetical protein
MDTKTLLAFILALQSADTDIANNTVIKQLANKLTLIRQQPEITPTDWANIQKKLTAILENHASLNQLYQQKKAQLEEVNITPDLLPTPAELKAAKPANRQVGTLGYPPAKPELDSNEIPNFGVLIDTASVILKDKKPAEMSKSLLQRLTDFLKQTKTTK